MTASERDEPSELYDPAVEPGMRRLRRAIVREDDERVRAAMEAMRRARPIGLGFLAAEKGPFDEPPAEPVDLDPDALPWELRDDAPDTADGERSPGD